MTVTTDASTTTGIGVTVPDARQAAEFLAPLLGVPPVIRSADHASVSCGQVASVHFTSADITGQAPPRVVDLGTNHLCLNVGDIAVAADHLSSQPGVTVLGDVITVPEGPIAGNKWIYFRSPWGTLFELQQWPDEPAYLRETTARLNHPHTELPSVQLPTCRGLDHTGYSVRNLDLAVAQLVDLYSATEVLRTEIAADRAFMTAQFDLDVEGTSTMAMVSAGALNIELFEHHIGAQDDPRPANAFGGNHLTLTGRTPDTGETAIRWIPGSL